MSDVYRRCGCRDENGKTIGLKCPKLASDPKHGSWGYSISAGKDPGTGKRVRLREMKFATKKEAQIARAKKLGEVTSGRYRSDQKLTVAKYFPDWLDRRVRDGLRPSTARMYRNYITADIVPALGATKLADLRRTHIDTFVQKLQKDGRGATTIRRIHAVISSALTAAERLDLVDFNAASKIALPATGKTKVRIWEPAQADVFLKAVEKHRLGALFELEILTGLRRGEICGLRWEDVDLTARELVVRVQLTQLAGDVVEGPVKTDSGQDRMVSLDDRAVGALMVWQITQDTEREAWAEAYTDSGRVFTYEDGRQLRPAHVSRVFDTVVERTKLPDIRFHDLRHLHASLMISAGIPLAVISKRLGHSTIAVTSDLYGHLLRDANRQAAEAASSLLAPRIDAGHTLATPE